jgi:RNase H-like domain found in reverse transcriptase
MAAPLSNLTKKKVSFDWIEPHEVAFDALKTSFTTAPVLKLPDPTNPYVVKTDTSTSGIRAVLEQEEDDGFHPVAFASRKLQPAKVSYQVHDLELMAIVYALREWRVYLHGVFILKLRQTIILCVTWIRSRSCRNIKVDG